jgi:hypothetical protein
MCPFVRPRQDEFSIIEIQPEPDKNVPCALRRCYFLQHFDGQLGVVKFVSNLVQLTCEKGSNFLKLVSLFKSFKQVFKKNRLR